MYHHHREKASKDAANFSDRKLGNFQENFQKVLEILNTNISPLWGNKGLLLLLILLLLLPSLLLLLLLILLLLLFHLFLLLLLLLFLLGLQQLPSTFFFFKEQLVKVFQAAFGKPNTI